MPKSSKNRYTAKQIGLVCRHAREQCDSGISENFALRSLIVMVDAYAKLRKLGVANPDRADQFETWSAAAVELWNRKKDEEPPPPFGRWLRNEHGYGKAAFARKVLETYKRDGGLTEKSMECLVDKYWRVAVVTIYEDRELNKRDRSNEGGRSAEERWKEAGIESYAGTSPHFKR